MNKKALRRLFLSRRNEVSSAQATALSDKIASSLASSFDWSGIRFLHHFVSLADKNEVDTIAAVSAILEINPSIKLVVPRVNESLREIEHIEVTLETKFVESDWGIPEPVGNELVDEDSLDLVIVPLLCFDRRGNRVGYGGGYYDRFLAKCGPNCLKVGVSFFGPVDEIEDIHDGDVKLDYCVTAEEVYGFIDH